PAGNSPRRSGAPPGIRRPPQPRPEPRPTPPPSAHRPPSTLFSEERRHIRRRRFLRRRTLGQVSWLTAGERGRRPDGAFTSSFVLPPSRGADCPQWRPMEDVEPVRFLGPLPFTVAGPRPGLSPLPLRR